jgi:hypothetical protein
MVVKALLVLALLVGLFFLGLGFLVRLHGCATQSVQGVCRHNALTAAETWENMTGDDVRILTGKTPGGIGHAQAQAFIKGEWVWLSVSCTPVEACNVQDNFMPDKVWDVGAFRALHVSPGGGR